MSDAMQPGATHLTTVHLTIVVLNYRTSALTVECLRSLANEVAALPGTQVVVVDNASNDGSVEQIQTAIAAENWGSWVTFLPQSDNSGYAAGNNAAIRPALAADSPPDYALLLNPDTVIRPGAVKTLVNFMESHPEIGIAGSRLEDPDGTPQRSAFRFPSFLSEFEGGLRLGLVSKLLAAWIVAPPVRDEAHPTDWVAGASMIIRRQVFADAGLMDEKYFLYFEELDFCLAAHRAGWPCWYVPDSRVVHYVGQSSGISDLRLKPKRRPTYWFDSRRRFFVKNYGWAYAVLTESAWMLGFALWRVRRAIQQKPDLDPPNFLSDFWLNSVLVKGVEI